MSEPLAHSGGHMLVDHLKAVAALASKFSLPFEAAEPTQRWAYLAGLWHDQGKYRPGFQRCLQQSGSPDAHIEGKVGGREKTHSAAGALWAMQRLTLETAVGCACRCCYRGARQAATTRRATARKEGQRRMVS